MQTLYHYKITEITPLAPDILGYELTPLDEFIEYQAGQYVEIQCPDGQWLPFSLANAPQNDGVKALIVRKSSQELSLKSLIDASHVGSVLSIRGPMGEMMLTHEHQGDVVMLAGGTGIAPIKAVLENNYYLPLSRTSGPTSPTRGEVHLFWGVRSPDELFLADHINAWLEAGTIKSFTPVVSGNTKNWQGATGWVHDALLSQFPDLLDLHIFASGPMDMIRSALRLYPEYGHDVSQFYSDMLPFIVR